MEYTVDYFIEKFSNIPEKDFGTSNLKNRCALYYCGIKDYNKITDEAEALIKLFGGKVDRKNLDLEYTNWSAVYVVNDGLRYNDYYSKFKCDVEGETPKERILNKLKQIKENQNKIKI